MTIPIGITINAIDNCKNNQWILYHEIPFETLEYLAEETNDCNAIMLEYYRNDNYKNFNQLYSKYKDHRSLSQHKLTLDQAFYSFSKGNYYNLIVYSLIPIFDGVLAHISANDTHQFRPRLDNVLNFNLDDIPDEDAVKIYALLITFDVIEIFCKRQGTFGVDPEPSNLNRHYILHGRSEKQFSEIDCLKLFNFIFALLYLDETKVLAPT